VGREQELAAVIAALTSGKRLLTLTGPGGVGKTRLALAAAARVASAVSGNVWLVDLTALAEPLLVPQAVAAGLGVREGAGSTLIDSLCATLFPRTALLVLDNAEHVLEACAALVSTLLRACPRLAVLATSREPLHIGGE
jgi:predicted ATPase